METEVTTVESEETNVWTSELERSPNMKRGIGGRNAPVCFQTGTPGGQSVSDYDLLLRVGLCFADASLTPLMCFWADKDELNIFYLFKNPRPTILLLWAVCDWINDLFLTQHLIITGCAPDPIVAHGAPMGCASPQLSRSTPLRSAGWSSLRLHHRVEVVATLCRNRDLLPNIG